MSQIIAAIDIGSNTIRVVAGQLRDEKIVLLARSSAQSAGVRNGYITNKSDVYVAVKKAIRLTEKQIGQQIKEIYVTAGGGPMATKIVSSPVAVSHGDSIVTEFDIEQSIRRSVKKTLSTNQRNIDSIILHYKLDGQETVSEPIGMKGKKLDVEAMLFNYASQNIDAAEDVLDQIEVDTEDFLPAIIGASIVSLSTIDRKVGCVLIDIGSDATSYVVYEHDAPIHVGYLEQGSDSITQAIALEYQISVSDAEIIKLGGPIAASISSEKVHATIKKATIDIFKKVNADLKSIEKSGNLPGGAVLCGAGSMLQDIDMLARDVLKIPTRKALIRAFKRQDADERELGWASVYGVAIQAMDQERSKNRGLLRNLTRKLFSAVRKFSA